LFARRAGISCHEMPSCGAREAVTLRGYGLHRRDLVRCADAGAAQVVADSGEFIVAKVNKGIDSSYDYGKKSVDGVMKR
jgi:hypothetical protein